LVLPAWFDHLEESFSYKEVQFKMFGLLGKTSYPPAENITETPEHCFKFSITYLISASTQEVRPYSAAECIAVHPSAVLELTSAPCRSSASKHAKCPYSAA